MADYLAKVKGVFPNGETWSTSRHITSSQAGASLLTSWANAWTAAWTDSTHGMQQYYNTGTKITAFDVSLLDGQMKEVSGPGEQAVNLPGTSAGKTLPSQISLVASWRSSTQKGRRTHGHQALPAPSEDVVTNNKLDSGAMTQFSAALNAIRTAVTADGSTFFVYNRFATIGGIAPYTKVITDTVSIRDKVGTQDRRYRKEAATYL